MVLGLAEFPRLGLPCPLPGVDVSGLRKDSEVFAGHHAL